MLKYQKYAFEYEPGREDGKIAWFVGEHETFRMTGIHCGNWGSSGTLTTRRKGSRSEWKHWPTRCFQRTNVNNSELGNQRRVDVDRLGKAPVCILTSYPGSVLTQTRPALERGTVMQIDYVRIYQEEGKELITCDPRMFPRVFLKKHVN